MVYTFDFLEFADKVAGTRIIKDAWGNEVNLGEVELVLTTSMVKLWDSYQSCEEYLRNCQENGYTFSIPKVCPKAVSYTHLWYGLPLRCPCGGGGPGAGVVRGSVRRGRRRRRRFPHL